MDLSRFPRRRYTHAATPLEPLPRFSAEHSPRSCPGGVGPEVWVKRDDLLGLFPGGNKTRKLEFLVADALAQGADTLVTCGAPQSNHCRITLAAAVKEGLKCRFVIEERVPGSYTPRGQRQQLHVPPARCRGHHRGARRRRHGRGDAAGGRRAGARRAARPTSSRAAARTRWAAWATWPARRSCSSSASSMGLRFDRRGRRLGQLGHARRAGGRLPGQPHRRCRSSASASAAIPADQEPLVHREAQAVADLLRLGPDGAARGGAQRRRLLAAEVLGAERAHGRGACRWLARSEGLLLDPVYTGKTMAGLIGLARAGASRAGERCCSCTPADCRRCSSTARRCWARQAGFRPSSLKALA